MKRIFWNILSLFSALFVLTFEFEYSIIPNLFRYINPLFEALVSFSGSAFFCLDVGFNPTISSDSIGLYIQVFNLILLCFILTFALELIFKSKRVNLRLYFIKIAPYYLSLQLLIYGFDKVFKAQFFLPEPNTLFTPLKDISRDLLYWSTVGVSRGYSMFLGFAEVATAFFLLFRKTRLVGILFGIGIMLNVVAVNFGFNISVKVYSLFLLVSFIGIGLPYCHFLFQVLVNQNQVNFPKEKELFLSLSSKWKFALKSTFILVLIVESLFPFIKTNNFNGDTLPRPKFHGAYSISNPNLDLINVFVHRQGYLIFKNKKEKFQDFQLEVDSINSKFLLFDYENNKKYELIYTETNNQLKTLEGNINGNSIKFALDKIDWQSSPLFTDKFQWTTNIIYGI